jgi:hypothetical protein
VRAAIRRPFALRKVRSSAAFGSSGARAAYLLQDPDLDEAVLQAEGGTLARDRDRFFERIGFHDQDASDGFLGFHEWTLDDLTAAHGESRTRLILQLVGVDMARLLARRRGEPSRVEEGNDPTNADGELFASGALLPGPGAKLVGPTFEQWLDALG